MEVNMEQERDIDDFEELNRNEASDYENEDEDEDLEDEDDDLWEDD